MILYTCPVEKKFGSIGHPCGKAALALEAAGIEHHLVALGGFARVPFTVGNKRDIVKELTGSIAVPVLLFDNGDTISGSQNIVDWAKAQPSAAPVA